MDPNSRPEEREFSSILTMREMSELCMANNPQMLYLRLPLPEDRAPEEKVRYTLLIGTNSANDLLSSLSLTASAISLRCSNVVTSCTKYSRELEQ